jgi:signal peptidase I
MLKKLILILFILSAVLNPSIYTAASADNSPLPQTILPLSSTEIAVKKILDSSILLTTLKLVIGRSYDIVTVGTKSMEPNYMFGDKIYIDLITPNIFGFKRGDIVIAKVDKPNPDYVGDCDLFIKRIIGLPGDIVIFDSGKVIIMNKAYPDGITIDESTYLLSETKTYKKINTPDEQRVVETVLKPGEYYILGDNRSGSKDSRLIGPVKSENIYGREFYRVSPASKKGFYSPPIYPNIGN